MEVNIKQENWDFIKKIWDSESFKNGNSYCVYGAHLILHLLSQKEIQENVSYGISWKNICFVNDFNADFEVWAGIKIDDETGKIFHINMFNGKTTYVADTFEEMFEKENISNYLTNREDKNIHWSEYTPKSHYNEDEFPNCYFPKFDFRTYLREKYNVFINDIEQFDNSKFKKYIESINAINEFDPEFCHFYINDELIDEIEEVNKNNPQLNLKILSFITNEWGLIDLNTVSEDDKRRINKFQMVK